MGINVFRNIKEKVRKTNQSSTPVWMQNSEVVVDGDIDVDKANEPSSIDSQVVESPKKPTTRRKASGRKNGEESSSSRGLDELWNAAKTSKSKKGLKESQVWVDDELYRKIELLNLKSGKPVPTKHIVNAILQLYLDEHKTEISKASK